jgi:hypothetical protein
MKRFVLFTIVFCLLSAFMVTVLQAQQKVITPKTRTNLKVQKKLVLRLKTDLRVDVIHSSRCKCDLRDVGAFYMANIMVDVSNHKVAGVGASTESILTVTYFDMNQGRMVTVTKNLPKMHPYPTNPWTLQRYVVVNHPVLVKAGTGIKAVIKSKATNISDPIPGNNIKMLHKCQVMVY